MGMVTRPEPESNPERKPAECSEAEYGAAQPSEAGLSEMPPSEMQPSETEPSEAQHSDAEHSEVDSREFSEAPRSHSHSHAEPADGTYVEDQAPFEQSGLAQFRASQRQPELPGLEKPDVKKFRGPASEQKRTPGTGPGLKRMQRQASGSKLEPGQKQAEPGQKQARSEPKSEPEPSSGRAGLERPGRVVPLSPVLDPLGALIEGVCDVDLALRRTHADRYRAIENARVEAIASADDAGRSRRVAEDFAFRSLAAELACALHMSEMMSRRLLDEAQQLTHRYQRTLEALESGVLDVPQVRDVLTLAATLPEELRDQFEELVLEKAARGLSPAQFRRICRSIRERLHDEPLATRVARSFRERRLCLDADLDGMVWLSLYTSADKGIAIATRIHDLARHAGLHDVDGVDEGERDTRTVAQREADVATDLLLNGQITEATLNAEAVKRSGMADTAGPAGQSGGSNSGLETSSEDSSQDMDSSHRPTSQQATPVTRTGGVAAVRPVVFVTVPVMTLLGQSEQPGEISGGTAEGVSPIDADTARRLAGESSGFYRILTHPETGEHLSFGQGRYRVPAGLRRYLQVRDGTCRFPGCGRRAHRCEIDHTTAWAHGGGTDADNLGHLCLGHHRLKHHAGWKAQQHPRGVMEWTSPTG